MKNQNQTTTRAAEIMTHATAAASVAIRGKHSQSGNKKLTAMQNSRKADTITAATADTMSEAGTLRAKAADLRTEAKSRRAYANQSGRTPAEVRTARAEAKKMDRAAAKLDTAAKAKEDSTEGRTFSDFQPIAHEAIMGRMTAERTPYIVTPSDMDRAAARLAEAVKNHEPGTPWKAMNAARSAAAMAEANPAILFEMAYSGAIFRAATNAANKAITANLHHDSHTRTTTTKTLATPEIMEAWRAVHGNNSGEAYRVYLDRDNANWHTMEYRTYKAEPSGWYLIHHHKTIAPTVSIEAFTEDSHGAEAALVTNGGIPSIETQEARERIEAIIEDMNPTAREADFLRYFLSTKAAHAGQIAVNEALATKTRARRAEAEAKAAKRTAAVQKTKQAQEAAEAAHRAAKAARAEADKVPNETELIRYRAMRTAAAAHVGIQTTTAETTFINRLKARVLEAAKVEQGCTTPEEAAEAEAKDLERMQKNSTRGRNNAEAVQVLFVGIDSPEAIAKAAAVIQKKAKSKKATKADKARAERAAKATKADTVSNWKPGEAITINRTFTDPNGNRHTWQEQVAMKQTASKVEPMTPEEVEAMTARERAAEAERLNQYGGNIAFIEYRRRMRYEAARTPWKALDATAAALVFLDHMTPEEQAAVMEARRAERAADTARLKAEAAEAAKTHADTWNSRPAYQISPKAWNAMHGQDRLTLLDTIHANGQRLEIVTA